MKKILWLPAWYPNKISPFDGDFIQRHARAAAIYCAVRVIHVIRDREGFITKSIKEDSFRYGNLEERIIYYYTTVHPIALIDKVISTRRYNRLYRKAINDFIKAEGLPSCAHVHVVDKNGMLACWLKKKYAVPFVISEHWTGYLAEAIPNFENRNRLFKLIWSRTMKAAKGLSVVSNYLGDAIKKINSDTRFTVIPNVVDDTIFFPVHRKAENIMHFIHVSTLGYQKNPEMILQAFNLVKKDHPSFKLSVFGPGKIHLKKLVAELGLEEQVFFCNEVPQRELAVYMQHAHALVLYSRYETFGCVLIEANACGTPAIVSDIPVFHEIIEEGINGHFATGENPAALASKIVWFMKQGGQLPGETMAAATSDKYNFATVGKLFLKFYTTILQD